MRSSRPRTASPRRFARGSARRSADVLSRIAAAAAGESSRRRRRRWRSEADLAETAGLADGSGELVTERADVGDADDVQRAVDAAVARFGKLTAIVNNAGALVPGKVLETTLERLRAHHGCERPRRVSAMARSGLEPGTPRFFSRVSC
jgi:NAD(P)-dependent dehydrogenase (short-subunit alcohol dehydrogenase family)